MKTLILFLVSLIAFSSVKAYEVKNREQDGFEVVADNFVYIITPDNKKIQVTNFPFVDPDCSMPPIEPILCSWDPSHNWLGIFITTKKITEIHLFNLHDKTFLKVEEINWSQYPAWMARPEWFMHEKPLRWKGNALYVEAFLKFRNGDSKRFHEVISIRGNTFKIAFDKNDS